MEILSWNIQAAKGVDGRVDIARIVDVIEQTGTPDVSCLQEVAQCYPEVDAGLGLDQPATLGGQFPNHATCFGVAVDHRGSSGDRQRFGNLVLSRFPIEQVFFHPLPQPADGSVRHMPRQATEVVISCGSRTLRIVTTHLEAHSQRQRAEQIDRILSVQREVAANVAAPPRHDEQGPYGPVPRPATAVY